LHNSCLNLGCSLQAEPTAEVVKERYVAPIAAIVKEQV
jgi:hypothetical protein